MEYHEYMIQFKRQDFTKIGDEILKK